MDDLKREVLDKNIPPFERLKKLMEILRSPGGCEWDRKQTHSATEIQHGHAAFHQIAQYLRRIMDQASEPVIDEIAAPPWAYVFDHIQPRRSHPLTYDSNGSYTIGIITRLARSIILT